MVSRKRREIIKGLVLLCCLVAVFMWGLVRAETEYEREPTIPAHYPDKFDGMGRIDRLEPPEIVINDSLRILASRVSYNVPSGKRGSKNLFAVGRFVGFKVNSRGEIAALYLLK